MLGTRIKQLWFISGHCPAFQLETDILTGKKVACKLRITLSNFKI
jgi:hypothetical protein